MSEVSHFAERQLENLIVFFCDHASQHEKRAPSTSNVINEALFIRAILEEKLAPEFRRVSEYLLLCPDEHLGRVRADQGKLGDADWARLWHEPTSDGLLFSRVTIEIFLALR